MCADKKRGISPLIDAVERTRGACVIAIDGRAGSGKSALASRIAVITGAGVVHMDDFFLPEKLRTQQRLMTPGGNVHYERFIDEIMPKLKSDSAFSYARFDCALMRLHGEVDVAASRIRIVEGSYSCHSALGDYADIKVFCSVSKDVQLARITERSGTAKAKRFKTTWIPMEEKYFSAFSILENADAYYDGVEGELWFK